MRKAMNKFQRWTKADDKMLADTSMSTKKVAILLGRTVGAVQQRRYSMGINVSTDTTERAKKAWKTRRANGNHTWTKKSSIVSATPASPAIPKDLKFVVNGVDVSISKSVRKVFVAKQHIAIDF